MRTALLLATAAITLAATPATAHRQWFFPAVTTLADTEQWVTIDAAVSNDLFYPDHVAMRLEQVKVWQPDGSEGKIENPATARHRSTFDVRVDKAGTWKIGTENNAVMGSFKLNGEEWRVGGRRGGGPGGPAGPGAPGAPGARPAPGGATPPPGGPGGPQGGPPRQSVATAAEIPAGATDVKLTEVTNRNFVFVTAGEPTQTVFAPTGKGLEMQPISHPDALVSDEEAQFRYLVDGKPAAGVKVEVVPGGKRFREAEGAQELTTGADGVLRVKWPVPGVYWISASLTDDKATTPRATDRRMGYTMTVEVPAP